MGGDAALAVAAAHQLAAPRQQPVGVIEAELQPVQPFRISAHGAGRLYLAPVAVTRPMPCLSQRPQIAAILLPEPLAEFHLRGGAVAVEARHARAAMFRWNVGARPRLERPAATAAEGALVPQIVAHQAGMILVAIGQGDEEAASRFPHVLIIKTQARKAARGARGRDGAEAALAVVRLVAGVRVLDE